MPPSSLPFLLLSIGLLAVGAMSAVADDGVEVCLGASEADAAVRAGEAKRLAALRGTVGNEILEARLCRVDSRLFYRLVLFDDRGAVRRATLDARSGRLVYDDRR